MPPAPGIANSSDATVLQLFKQHVTGAWTTAVVSCQLRYGIAGIPAVTGIIFDSFASNPTVHDPVFLPSSSWLPVLVRPWPALLTVAVINGNTLAS